MKLLLTFLGLSAAEQWIVPMDNCDTVSGGHGRNLQCPDNGGYQYVVGFCSSGQKLDCVNKSKSHEYTCCNTHQISGHNQCYQKFGTHG